MKNQLSWVFVFFLAVGGLTGCHGEDVVGGDEAVGSKVQEWLVEIKEASSHVGCSATGGEASTARVQELLSLLPVRREKARVMPSQALLAYHEVHEALACLSSEGSSPTEGANEILQAEKSRILGSLSQRLTMHYALYRKAMEEEQSEAALNQIEELCALFQDHDGPLLARLQKRERALRLLMDP